jgi:hypothetical protein
VCIGSVLFASNPVNDAGMENQTVGRRLQRGNVMAYIISKSIFKSKTFWANVAMGVAAFLLELPVGADVQVAIATAVNVLLRYNTKQPVHIVEK